MGTDPVLAFVSSVLCSHVFYFTFHEIALIWSSVYCICKVCCLLNFLEVSSRMVLLKAPVLAPDALFCLISLGILIRVSLTVCFFSLSFFCLSFGFA